MSNKKNRKSKKDSLVDKHGFDTIIGAFLAVPKKKRASPKAAKPKKQKRRDLKK